MRHLIRSLAASLLLAAALMPAGGAGAEESAPGVVQPDVRQDVAADQDTSDPWVGMNRRVFAFNEGLDRYFLEPVATGWDTVVPEPAQKSVGNFFDNLAMPVRFVNDLLQGKPWRAYETAWRIAINTTVGIGGLFDPASRWQVYKSDEDFGQTLGTWHVPPGPYWVLPLLGPSSPRDAAGMIVDRTASVASYFVPFYVSVPASAVDIVNDRADVLESIRAERETAFDFYTFVRSAYVQFRENQVRDREEDPDDAAQDEDLYYLDEDDDDA